MTQQNNQDIVLKWFKAASQWVIKRKFRFGAGSFIVLNLYMLSSIFLIDYFLIISSFMFVYYMGGLICHAVNEDTLRYQPFAYRYMGLDPNKIEFGSSPLCDAIRRGDQRLVCALIEAGADVNARDQYGDTALSFAIERNQSTIAQDLIAAGAEVHHLDRKYMNPLHQAASLGRLQIIQSLIDAGSNINALNKWNQTPYDRALSEGQMEATELLAKNGADLKNHTSSIQKYLSIAAEGDHSDLVDSIVSQGVLDFEKSKGLPLLNEALITAIVWKNYFVARTLIQHGADIHVMDNGVPLLSKSHIEGYETFMRSFEYHSMKNTLVEPSQEVKRKIFSL